MSFNLSDAIVQGEAIESDDDESANASKSSQKVN